MISEISPWALLVLWAVVAFGAVLPVLPTGAAVSGAAVIAGHDNAWQVVLVVAVGAAGAWTGDVVTYRVLCAAGMPLAERVGWLRSARAHLDDGEDDDESLLDRLRTRLERNEVRTLLVSRLVPGGRIPVLLVAALTGYPWQRFVGAAVAAASLWSLVYAAVGVLGSTVVPDDRIALVVALVAALALSVVVSLLQRGWRWLTRRRRSRETAPLPAPPRR